MQQMAKGQVSEEELSKGLKGIGNFGGLTTPRVRRDNPFRDSSAEPAKAEPTKTIEVIPTPEKRVAKVTERPAPKIEQSPVRPVAPVAKVVERRSGAEKKLQQASGRKADIFTERVTLQISPEMRDEVERIARELQRSKTSKGERITANTVMRVAIRLMINSFELKGAAAPSSEEALFEYAERLFK